MRRTPSAGHCASNPAPPGRSKYATSTVPYRLVGIDGDTIDLVANRTINADSQSDVAEARRAIRLETTATVSGINVCADVAAGCRCDEWVHHDSRRWSMPPYRVDAELELRVPRDTALRLCTVNGGDVTVDRTSGGFDVSHVNGDIKMSDVRGSGRAATVNGAVLVSFVDVSTSASSFKTVNGDVAVSFPPGVSLESQAENDQRRALHRL